MQDDTLTPGRPRPGWTLLVNAAVGIAFACYFFGRQFPTGAVTMFIWPQDDFQQYLTGSKFFVYDAWHFPLLVSSLVERSYPQSMAFTDCIPLLALITKVVYKAVGYEIPYLAWWYILVVVAQPISFGLLLWFGGVRSKLLIALGGIFALLMPTFLYRGAHHGALFGHFTFIAAMALYFASTGRRPWPRWIVIAWPLWLLFCASVNLYLLAMAGAFFVAAVVQAASRDLVQGQAFAAGERALYGAGTIAAVALLMFVIGLFVPYALVDPGTLDVTGTNLISPFVPKYSALFSAIDAFADKSGAQHEGYNYFGAGFLILILVSIVRADRRIPCLLAQNPALVLVVLAMTVYSFSTSIYAGKILLLSYSLPDFTTIYRSAGRFVWPATYLILFLSLYGLDSWRPLWWPCAAIGACLLLQWQDARDLSDALWHMGHDTEKPALDNDPTALRSLIAQHHGVYMAPDYGCNFNGRISDTNKDIAWYAALEHKPVNTLYFARRPIDEDCRIDRATLDGKLQQDYLVAVFYDHAQPGTPLAGFTCREHDDGEVCLASRKVQITDDLVREAFRSN